MKPAVSHAAKRLAERYGIQLSKDEMGALIRRLKKGEGTVVDKQDGTSERRLITVREQSVIVVWSPTRAFIISVLPKRRNLPKLRRKDHGRDGRMKREGKRPDHAPEYE